MKIYNHLINIIKKQLQKNKNASNKASTKKHTVLNACGNFVTDKSVTFDDNNMIINDFIHIG